MMCQVLAKEEVWIVIVWSFPGFVYYGIGIIIIIIIIGI